MLSRLPIILRPAALVAALAAWCLIFCPHEGLALSDLFCAVTDAAHEGHADDGGCDHDKHEHSHDHDCAFDGAHSHEIRLNQQETLTPDLTSTSSHVPFCLASATLSAARYAHDETGTACSARLLASVILRV